MDDSKKIQIYENALNELTKGRGPFKRDSLEHADSCIETMKQVAKDALELKEVDYD